MVWWLGTQALMLRPELSARLSGPSLVPSSESLHLPVCPVWIPGIYLMTLYCPSGET